MSPKPTVAVKVCGLTDRAGISAAAEAGAAYVGFVMFPPSPRSLAADAVADLAVDVPPGVVKVALTVDPDDALVSTLARLPIDMLQLHGGESPARVREVRERTGLPVMKAIGVRTVDDLEVAQRYIGAADQLLLDAKPPEGATRPGGNAVAFDWDLLTGFRLPLPWLLAGGLTPRNVAEAVRRTGARQVDVSSGVERAPAVKDPDQIRAFLRAVDGASGRDPVAGGRGWGAGVPELRGGALGMGGPRTGGDS